MEYKTVHWGIAYVNPCERIKITKLVILIVVVDQIAWTMIMMNQIAWTIIWMMVIPKMYTHTINMYKYNNSMNQYLSKWEVYRNYARCPF